MQRHKTIYGSVKVSIITSIICVVRSFRATVWFRETVDETTASFGTDEYTEINDRKKVAVKQ